MNGREDRRAFPSTLTKRRRGPWQNGFSLVELMVAMVLSLIVLAGVIQLYLRAGDSQRLQQGLSLLHENGRVAHFFLSRTLRLAGHRSVDDVKGNVSLSGRPVQGGNDLASSTTIDGTTVRNGTDTITIRYRGNADGLTDDCLGADVGTDVEVSNVFFVAADDNTLRCSVTNGTTTTTRALVEGVENMQVLYGIDTNEDQAANDYVTANSIGTNSVVSVRFAVLVNTIDPVAPDDDGKTYDLLGTSHTPIATADDLRQRRRVYATAVNLRNLAQ